MDEKEAIGVLTAFKEDNDFEEDVANALDTALKALEDYLKIEAIVNAPAVFAEKFDDVWQELEVRL